MTDSVTALFKLSLLDCDRSDPLADFFTAHASIDSPGVAGETAFTAAGRDLHVFVADAGKMQGDVSGSAVLLGGWDAESCLRLAVSRTEAGGPVVAHVSMLAHEQSTELETRVESEFVVPPDALSAFLAHVQHLVDRREPGHATLTGDAHTHA